MPTVVGAIASSKTNKGPGREMRNEGREAKDERRETNVSRIGVLNMAGEQLPGCVS